MRGVRGRDKRSFEYIKKHPLTGKVQLLRNDEEGFVVATSNGVIDE